MFFARTLLCYILFSNCTYIFCSVGVKHKITQYGNCNLTKEEYDTENLVGHTWSFYKFHGKTLLRIAYTVKNKTPPLSYKLRGYQLKSLTSQRKEDLSLDMNCRNPILSKVMRKMRVNIDLANCTAKPGTFLIPKVDMAEFSRFYKYTAKNYPFYQFEFEVSTKKGVIICTRATLDLSTVT